ncbi:MAG: DNA topoisomerase [Clostridia bacterium]|nr:DNA topoisomerase [Clostridia bacterium]
MKLIIAEKPSLAKNIASAIGETAKGSGYIGGKEYIVTWAFGHLFSLAELEHYNPSPDGSGRWTMENLPCFPENFSYEIKKGADKTADSGALRQFETIKKLCLRSDVDTIINAGDADREGEIIVRQCIKKAFEDTKNDPFSGDGSFSKRLVRLWLPDQTPETVRAALSDLKEEDEYDNLAAEGYARTYIDWLYGVNLTRYATLRTGSLLRVGRVIVPIVRAIYERDMEIRNFVPGKYYALVSRKETEGEIVELVSRHKIDGNKLNTAERACAKLNSCEAVVTAVKRRNSNLDPGKLYSLSKLQNVLGKKFKMSMAESLEIVQKLYEEGYLTYPRTNSEYLATAEKDKIKKIIEGAKKLRYPLIFKDKKTIFDDSKIESHTAITPTYKIPDKNKLTEREYTVYSTVFKRFAAVFCAEDCVVDKTEITIDVGGLEEFSLKGTVVLSPGWTKYDDSEKKDKILPKLSKGDKVNICFEPVEKETTPPRHYTIETLNNYLKNPFREDKLKGKRAEETRDDNDAPASDEEDYRAIFEGLELGTEATRTGIIDNARKSGYIELKKDVYHILPDGEFLIESLGQMDINMDKYKTSEIGKALKKVFRGAMTVEDSVDMAKKEISAYFNHESLPIELDRDTGFFGDVVGTCPICGGDVVRYKYKYSCRNYKEKGCKFGVSCYICGRALSVSNMKKLLAEGKTAKIKGFVSKKSGKSFDAFLVLKEGEAKFEF